MIEVKEAVKIIEQTVLTLPAVAVPIERALGRILRQQIVADADFPPFNRVMMDGIAIRFDDFEKGIRTFAIQGVQAAGSAQMILQKSANCIEVMTGAVSPEGTDLVIPYEEVNIDSERNVALVQIDEVVKGKNIHKQGSDKSQGDLLVEEGKLIGTPEIAVATSVGLTEIKVTKNPSIAIISTGDELVSIHEQPLPYQIRRSNVHTLAAELRHFGIKSNLFHFNDEKENLKTELAKVLQEHDVLLMSGGVSRGKFDFVPGTLESIGVQKLFHRILQKPGKPFWFGATRDKKVVFAFPGNPVSTFLCYHKYFVPWLKKSLGIKTITEKRAVLAEDFSIKTRLTYFLQVKSSVSEEGLTMAWPRLGRGSGDHANLLSSDGFLELPANTYSFQKGEVFNFISFRIS